VVVLCGGLGTRLRPAVADRPKALAPVPDRPAQRIRCPEGDVPAGTVESRERPFLAVQLELLRDRGARHFVLCVGHLAEQIRATFGDGSSLGVRIDYSPDGEKLLGTAGALRRAERFFAPAAVVVNGDTYIDVDLDRLARLHSSARGRGALATLTIAEMLDSGRFGTVELNADGRVVRFREKGAATAGGWVNAGVYVIERGLLDRVPPGEVVSLERDVFPAALRDGVTLATLAHDRPFHDIGTPDDLRAFVRLREAAHAA
jgi:NDP-sugar pyrophosphorylase family protein